MSVGTSRNESDSTFDWRSRAKRAAFCRPSEKHSTLRPSLGNSLFEWVGRLDTEHRADAVREWLLTFGDQIFDLRVAIRTASFFDSARRTLSPTPCTVLVRRLFSRDLNLNMSGRPFVVYVPIINKMAGSNRERFREVVVSASERPCSWSGFGSSRGSSTKR